MTDKESLLAAHAAYYRAFWAGDFARMSSLWADEEISCVHPGWPVLLGREAVLESYRNILLSPSQERIEHRNDTPVISGDDGRVYCVEIVGGMALAVTNWFKLRDGAWRMIHHQASPIATMEDEDAPPSRLN
jgi:ketosteroid isomerase-like protein